ncbi:MAG: hypothetical protein N2745_01610 [Syntrophorhabdaceae bacterium]|nr:hypothetical protein [Syntrophorhabdaceae bacterium]
MKGTDITSMIQERLNHIGKAIKEVFYGLTAYELELELKKEKGHLNNLLMLIVFGDLVGLPLFPTYYALRILPYIVPGIEVWKRNILREKDLTEMVGRDI